MLHLDHKLLWLTLPRAQAASNWALPEASFPSLAVFQTFLS